MPRLAERYGVSVATIRAAVAGRTWAHVNTPIPAPFQPRPANVKLTPSKVRKARALYAKGAGNSDLARRYGVTPRTMLSALRGETWLDVE
jgi:uncharacterized protein YjcR